MPERDSKGKNLNPWIKELRLQRATMFGPMVIVETDDERRFRELLMQRPQFVNANGGEEWFTLETWKGLKKATISDDGKKIDYDMVQDIKPFAGEISGGLPKAEELIKDNKRPAVLVIKGMLVTNPQANNILSSWASDMDIMNKKSTIILFLEDRNIIPQAIWSHTKIVVPPKSTEDEREADLRSAMECQALNIDNKQMPSAIRLLAGLNLDQTDALITELSIRNNQKMDLDLLAKLKAQIMARDPIIDVLNPPKFGFEAVGGYDALKKRIYNDVILPIKYPEYAEEYGICQPKGIVMFGPPGCGKTIIAKSMQKELNMTMITLQPDKIFSKWVGESEKALRKVFGYLEALQPCIFFVDEFDKMGRRNTSSSSDDSGGAQVGRQIFSMLLEKLGDEERRWIFVANTNLIEAIDPAMLRTGRIDSVVPVPYPDTAARVEILKIHALKKRNLRLENNIDWDKLAGETEYWAGSDLENLIVRTATMKLEKAVKEGSKSKISQKDILEALSTFNVNTTANKKLQESIMDQAIRFTNDKRLKDIFKQTVDSKSFDTRMKSMSWEERVKEGPTPQA